MTPANPYLAFAVALLAGAVIGYLEGYHQREQLRAMVAAAQRVIRLLTEATPACARCPDNPANYTPVMPEAGAMTHTATLLRDLDGFTGRAALYRLTPPLRGHTYVAVSATNALFSGPETYIFPASPKGKVTQWGELPGSYQGGLDHAKALRDAGYVVKYPAKVAPKAKRKAARP